LPVDISIVNLWPGFIVVLWPADEKTGV